jgi:hypothetical protein
MSATTSPKPERSREASVEHLTMLDSALQCARHRWVVFPLQPRSKVPFTPHGHLDATNNVEQITEWWSTSPMANIGVALEANELVAIDIDPRHGGSYAELDRAVDLGRPLVSRTGGGGWHLLYRDAGIVLRTDLDHVGLVGIDVKQRGYIVAPPSVHPSGDRYRWEHECLTDLNLHAVLEVMPDAVVALCAKPPEPERPVYASHVGRLTASQRCWVEAALTKACDRLARATRGRHNALYYTARSIGEIVGAGALDRCRARSCIERAAVAMYGEQLWRSEQTTLDNGLDKGMCSPRSIPEDDARTMLAHVTASDTPAETLARYVESNPEVVRRCLDDALEVECKAALMNVYAVAGEPALNRAVTLMRSA